VRPGIAALLLLAALSGCATTAPSKPPAADSALDPAQARQIHLDLVRGMIAQGSYYAALAHIQELEKQPGPRDELLVLKAQTLARLGRKTEAEKIYTGLLKGPHAGEAAHGLGLLYASRNYATSLYYLRSAARLSPTDADTRSDLGYALLTGGVYDEARLNLATAYELNRGSDKIRNNYLLALLIAKDEGRAKSIAQASSVSQKTLDSLRKQARDWPQVVQRTRASTAQPVRAVPVKPAAQPAANTRDRRKGSTNAPNSIVRRTS
jgi:Flp pilus assembly protein TadD